MSVSVETMNYPTSINASLMTLLLVAVCMTGLFGVPVPDGKDHRNPDAAIVSFDSSFVIYRVHDGDYLSKISREFGIPMTEIMKANNIAPDHPKIYIGQELKVPTRGRTNQVLKARKQRIMFDSDNKLASLEKDMGALEHRLNHLKFEMDSLQFAIKELEKKEIIDDADFDENDMNALLRQMERAKEIGQQKQALEKYYNEREFEFLAKNQEAAQLSNNIDDLKRDFEYKAIENYQNSLTKDAPATDSEALAQHGEVAAEPMGSIATAQEGNAETGDPLTEDGLEDRLQANAGQHYDMDDLPPAAPSKKVEVAFGIQDYIPPEESESKELPFPSGPVDKEELAEVPKSKRKQVKFKAYKDKEKPSSQRLKAKTSGKSKKNWVREDDQRQEDEAFKGLADVDVTDEMDSINRIKAAFFLGRAITEIERRQYKKAEKFVNKSLKLSPENVEARVLQGDISATFGFDEKAIKHYNYALTLDSSRPQLFYNRAHCYLTLEKNEEAFHDFTRALEIDDQYILAYAGRASISVDINDFDAAISDYSKIIRLNRHFIPAYKGRGVAYMELGDYDRAMQDFNYILELSPNEPAIYYKRGLLKILTDQLYDACFDLWTADELGYREAKKAIKKYCN